VLNTWIFFEGPVVGRRLVIGLCGFFYGGEKFFWFLCLFFDCLFVCLC
jgi:hypothetical protein